MNTFMRFPGGLGKALTLSYDDGIEQDVPLMEILDKYGIKATFNVNTGICPPDGHVYPKGTISRRLPLSKFKEIYGNTPHEIAVHAHTHPHLEFLPTVGVMTEILRNRDELEKIFGRVIRGMAYPYGTYNDDVISVLKNANILYSRTVENTRKFDIPSDWLRLSATCHHKDKNLMALAEKFVSMNVTGEAQMFYLWGHSYEFEADDNWNVIEDFCKYVGGKDDIWYATNIEIFEYIEAYKRLCWSADLSMVYNPTARSIWVTRPQHRQNLPAIEIHPGETYKF